MVRTDMVRTDLGLLIVVISYSRCTIFMGVRRGENGHSLPLELGTNNLKFLENLKPAA